MRAESALLTAEAKWLLRQAMRVAKRRGESRIVSEIRATLDTRTKPPGH